VPLQQPVPQSVELQYATQVWLLHSLPALQAAQRAPFAPHAPLAVPGWQLPFASQQPLAQLVASHLHWPPTHSCPVGHATQAAPFAPHWAFAVPATHDVPLQHPVEQSAGSQ
jgi:hypothetical protein